MYGLKEAGKDLPGLQALFVAAIGLLLDDLTDIVTNATSCIDASQLVLYLPERIRLSFIRQVAFIKNETVEEIA